MVPGLPNAKGSVLFTIPYTNSNSSGALALSSSSQNYCVGQEYQSVGKSLTLDLSKDNPLYGASDTVQPPAIQLIPQIKY